MSWSPFPPEGRARSPTRGENRARPPALLRKPTTNVRLSPSSYNLLPAQWAEPPDFYEPDRRDYQIQIHGLPRRRNDPGVHQLLRGRRGFAESDRGKLLDQFHERVEQLELHAAGDDQVRDRLRGIR